MDKNATQPLVIHLNISSRLVAWLSVAVLALAFLSYLTFVQFNATATSPQAPSAGDSGLRQYYLSQGSANGALVELACADGYHMAAFWEIMDPSNLEYNTTFGEPRADNGKGPPSEYSGWVRTGYYSHNLDSEGKANCNAWTSDSASHFGSTAKLNSSWWSTSQAWVFGTQYCNLNTHVWCVED